MTEEEFYIPKDCYLRNIYCVDCDLKKSCGSDPCGDYENKKEGYEQGFDEGYKKATKRAYERQQDLTDTYIKDGEKIKQLGKENEELKNKLERLCKRNEILTNIIMDVFKLSVDLCTLCKSKGEYLPDCECLTDEDCLKQLIGLYGD